MHNLIKYTTNFHQTIKLVIIFFTLLYQQLYDIELKVESKGLTRLPTFGALSFNVVILGGYFPSHTQRFYTFRMLKSYKFYFKDTVLNISCFIDSIMVIDAFINSRDLKQKSRGDAHSIWYTFGT